ncbi:MAG: hypothetical protein ACLUFV_00855 [Acutalibacteraceae bacterium]
MRVPAYKEDVPLKVYFIGGMMSADNALISFRSGPCASAERPSIGARI